MMTSCVYTPGSLAPGKLSENKYNITGFIEILNNYN
jgi:hypothetical protein